MSEHYQPVPPLQYAGLQHAPAFFSPFFPPSGPMNQFPPLPLALGPSSMDNLQQPPRMVKERRKRPRDSYSLEPPGLGPFSDVVFPAEFGLASPRATKSRVRSVGNKRGSPKPVRSGIEPGSASKPTKSRARQPVRAVHFLSGEVREFESGVQAAHNLQLRQPNICAVLAGRLRKTGGWTFERLERPTLENGPMPPPLPPISGHMEDDHTVSMMQNAVHSAAAACAAAAAHAAAVHAASMIDNPMESIISPPPPLKLMDAPPTQLKLLDPSPQLKLMDPVNLQHSLQHNLPHNLQHQQMLAVQQAEMNTNHLMARDVSHVF